MKLFLQKDAATCERESVACHKGGRLKSTFYLLEAERIAHEWLVNLFLKKKTKAPIEGQCTT